MKTTNKKNLVKLTIINDGSTKELAEVSGRVFITNKSLLEISSAYLETAVEIGLDICYLVTSTDGNVRKQDFDKIIQSLNANNDIKSLSEFNNYFKFGHIDKHFDNIIFRMPAEPLFDLYLAYVQKSMPDFEYELVQFDEKIICNFD